MSDRPIHRMPVRERRELVEQLVGRHVVVVVDPHRDGMSNVSEVQGRLVAVALPMSGTVADQLVIERPGLRWPVCISLATVRSVEQ